MKNKNNSLTIIYKKEIEDSELDFTLRDKILGPKWSEQEERFDTIVSGDEKSGWQGESHAISIDRMIGHLDMMKQNGCNHVEIMYHTDHIGYVIYGLDIHRSTDHEVLEHKKEVKELEDKRKDNKIKELQAEIAKLKKK